MTETNSKSQGGESWVAGGEKKKTIIIIILNGYV